MKNLYFLLVALLYVTTVKAQNAEAEAIKKVIIDETTAWANLDTTAYFAAFADNELTQGAWNKRNLGYAVFNGFATLQKSKREDLKNNFKSFYLPNVERDNWLIKVLSPEWAWVNFTQKTKTIRAETYTSYETRLMHKEGGKWKINVVNALWDYKNVVMPAVNPDEEEIKKLMVDETNYFVERDFDKWAEGIVHEPYIIWTVTNGGEPGDVLTFRGWDSLKTFMSDFLGKLPPAFTTAMKKTTVIRDKWQIQIRGNTAFVSFNQHTENVEKQTKSDITETRVLERINGAWKIAMQATLVDFKDATPPIRTKY